jgi:septum formation protein
MRVVLQRVSRASVSIDGQVAGAIGRGFCLLVGFTHDDTSERVDWMADKVAGLRLFSDAEGKMNLGLDEVGGGLLVISQFTFTARRQGPAASFIAPPALETAIPSTSAPGRARPGARGGERRCGATCRSIHNDGPVTPSLTAHDHGEVRSLLRLPRRRQLLEMLGIPVRVVPPRSEVRRPVETPVDYVERLAREKALAVPGRLVLGADTTVVVRDEVLEKPVDAVDALRMLRKLQGRTHQVVTSIALVAGETIHQATDVTNVVFRRLDDVFLEAYVATGEPMDKAGAYGIQGYGAALVERIDGDFFSVMGLPIRLVLELLDEAGQPYRFEGRSETAAVTDVR